MTGSAGATFMMAFCNSIVLVIELSGQGVLWEQIEKEPVNFSVQVFNLGSFAGDLKMIFPFSYLAQVAPSPDRTMGLNMQVAGPQLNKRMSDKSRINTYAAASSYENPAKSTDASDPDSAIILSGKVGAVNVTYLQSGTVLMVTICAFGTEEETVLPWMVAVRALTVFPTACPQAVTTVLLSFVSRNGSASTTYLNPHFV